MVVSEPQGSIQVALHHHHHNHQQHEKNNQSRRRVDDETTTTTTTSCSKQPLHHPLHDHLHPFLLREHNEQQRELVVLVEYDEPVIPVHPDLEFEVFAELDDDDHNSHGNEFLSGGGQQQDSTTSYTLYREVSSSTKNPHHNFNLYISFILLVAVGTGNNVMAKLQAIPMYNYPIFLTHISNIIYIPVCFAYIVPVAKYGWFNQSISSEHLGMPKWPFMIMGLLDAVAGCMQVFASVYLSGPLLVLLPQAAIPLSMVLSRFILREKYQWTQYLGAAIVLLGVLVVLEPVISNRHAPDYLCTAINLEESCFVCQNEVSEEHCLSHYSKDFHYNTTEDDDAVDPPHWMLGQQQQVKLQQRNLLRMNMAVNQTDDILDPFGEALCQWVPMEASGRREDEIVVIWSLVMVASTIPMTLSTIYKEMAMSTNKSLDPIYMNGWISIYQFLFSLIVAIPGGLFSYPIVKPIDIPNNIWDGLLCYLGHGTIDSGCHPDVWCSFHAALFVNLFLLFNLLYTFFMMYVIKFGNTSLFFLAVTVMVPLSNLAFSLPGMPQSSPIHSTDLLALLLISLGLVLYRFWDSTNDSNDSDRDDSSNVSRIEEITSTAVANNPNVIDDHQQEQDQSQAFVVSTTTQSTHNSRENGSASYVDEGRTTTGTKKKRLSGVLDPLLPEPLLVKRSDDV